MSFLQILSNDGSLLAAIGAVMAVMLAGIGSAYGVARAGQAGTAIIAEAPDVFGSVLVLQLLPGTQGIYGLLIGFVIASKAGLLGASNVTITSQMGMQFLLGSLPAAIGGMLSSMAQSKVSASGIMMLGKRSEEAGKAIVLTVMVETYSVLCLLFSFLLVNGVQV